MINTFLGVRSSASNVPS